MAEEKTYLLECWWCTAIDMDADEKTREVAGEGTVAAASEGASAGTSAGQAGSTSQSLVPGEVCVVRAATVRTLLSRVRSSQKCKCKQGADAGAGAEAAASTQAQPNVPPLYARAAFEAALLESFGLAPADRQASSNSNSNSADKTSCDLLVRVHQELFGRLPWWRADGRRA